MTCSAKVRCSPSSANSASDSGEVVSATTRSGAPPERSWAHCDQLLPHGPASAWTGAPARSPCGGPAPSTKTDGGRHDVAGLVAARDAAAGQEEPADHLLVGELRQPAVGLEAPPREVAQGVEVVLGEGLPGEGRHGRPQRPAARSAVRISGTCSGSRARLAANDGPGRGVALPVGSAALVDAHLDVRREDRDEQRGRGVGRRACGWRERAALPRRAARRPRRRRRARGGWAAPAAPCPRTPAAAPGARHPRWPAARPARRRHG